LSDFFAAADQAWLWLGGSFLLAVVWSNVAELFRKGRLGRVGDALSRITTWSYAPWLLQFLRLLYYVGLPYAALLLGRDALSERFLGLMTQSALPPADVWRDWATDAGWTVALGAAAWLLLALGWTTVRRSLTTGEARADRQTTVPSPSGFILLREAIYHEVHWAFYRNAPLVAMQSILGAPYWGVWIGLTLVAAEAGLNPAWREGITSPHRAPSLWMRAALALVSSVLFLQTQNLWLAILIHWAVSWGLVVWMRAFPPQSTVTHPLQ